MAHHYEEIFDIPPRGQTVTSNQPGHHTRRSWSNNGGHYTVETSSYSTPSFSFGMMGSTAQIPFPSSFSSTQTSSRPQSSSVLGNALGLLENVFAAQQQTTARSNTRRDARHSSEEDLAYGEDVSDGQPRSVISKFAERLINTSQRPRFSRSRDHSRDRATRTPPNVRSRSYRTEEREPRWARGRSAYVEEFNDSESGSDSEDEEILNTSGARRAFTANDASVVKALQSAAEHHRRQARRCRERIQQLCRRPATSTSTLQNLLNELKSHETAYENALQNLKMVKEESRGSATPRKATRHRIHTQHTRQQTSTDDQFSGMGFSDDFDTFSQSKAHIYSQPATSDDFDLLFGSPFTAFQHMFTSFGFRPFVGHDMPHICGIPREAFGGSQHSHSGFAANPRPDFRRPACSATYSAPPQSLPTTLLRSREAKQLFTLYNERWSALTATDPNIPYPARGLRSASLVARDTIWAPLVTAPVLTWSEEAVMQANTQAFFLAVVGLTPEYSEAGGTGRIIMGYNKAEATPPRVKELVNILKREKTRWHSDRLGRRNSGMAGANETLQRDVKARAVFHAVCELMEVAK